MTFDANAPTAMLATARGLASEISARAGEGEALRTMPSDLVDKLKRAGFFRMTLPRSLGGMELDPVTTFEITEALTEADGSSGWTVMIGNGSNAIFAWLDPRVAADMIGTRVDFSSTSMFAPLGTAVRDERGALIISGRWPFNSGCVHSEWLEVGIMAMQGAAPGVRPDGAPDRRLAFVPRALANIEDTWYAAGLRGTGSHHLSITAAHISPEHTIAPFNEPARQQGPLWRLPFLTLLTVLAAGFPLGIARRALHEFTALATVKVRGGATTSVAHDGYVQVEFARAEAEVMAARCFVLDAISDIWRTASAGGAPSLQQRARMVLASNQAMRASVDAVHRVFRLAGASAVMEDQPLQRCFRDIHTANQHLFWSDTRDQAVARLRLSRSVDRGAMAGDVAARTPPST
jgi:alkylation response protein AidB-like acyl-CoA dehydrogenase